MTSVAATAIDFGAGKTDAAPEPDGSAAAGWICSLLQATDSFYPTGSYAHSFGLEGMVHQGVVHNRDTLRRMLVLTVLPALRHSELPLAAHAWRGFAEGDWEAIGKICMLSSALKAPGEIRTASESIGRQRAELATRLHRAPLAQEYLERAGAAQWPFSSAVSAALEGRIAGAPLEAVLAGFVYSNSASLLSAAMKLLRLGQNSAHSLLAEVLAPAPALITAAMATPLDEIGWFNPWLDIAAARHESADTRMFMS